MTESISLCSRGHFLIGGDKITSPAVYTRPGLGQHKQSSHHAEPHQTWGAAAHPPLLPYYLVQSVGGSVFKSRLYHLSVSYGVVCGIIHFEAGNNGLAFYLCIDGRLCVRFLVGIAWGI